MLCTKSYIYVPEVTESHISVFLKIKKKINVFSTKLN